jgi:hypothetical protein
MRILALLLLLANIGIYCWARYVAMPEVTVVSTPVPIPESNVPLLALANESSQAKSSPNSDSGDCISVGPIEDEAKSAAIAERLQTAGFTSAQRIEMVDEFAGYWVTMDQFASKAQAEKVLQQLHEGGITDAYVFTDEAPSYLLSLGLFSERSRAEARRVAVSKLGFEPSINDRTRKVQKYWLDVTLQFAGQSLDPALLKSGNTDIVRLETRSCVLDKG